MTVGQLDVGGGQRIGYLDIGRGRPVVLLHGFGMRAAHWRLALPALHRRYRLILPDFRGFGSSHRACYTDPDVIAQSAEDLHRLLDALALPRRPVLVGLSMGACVAMHYLGRYGDDAIAGYVNVDQAVRVRNGDGWRWGLFGAAQRRWFDELLRLADAIDRLPAAPRTIGDVPTRLRLRLEWTMARFFRLALDSHLVFGATVAGARMPLLGNWLLPRRNLQPLLACMRAYATRPYDFREGLARVRIPVVAMVGLRSRLYPPAGQFQFRRLVPDCRPVAFPGAGHAVPFDAPLQFRRALVEAVAAM